jgi:hypothetical protein
MALPKAVKERINRKLRKKRGVKDKSMAKRVAPRKYDGRPPIEGPSHHARIEDDVKRVVKLIPTVDARTLIESLDESLIQPLHKSVSNLILMQLGGWREEGHDLVHEGGLKIGKHDMKVVSGRIQTAGGKQFFFCESEKLHEIRESLEKACRLLDEERKFDLFCGLREVIDAR